MFRELVAALVDACQCGHWLAHLVSWWRVVTGRVRPGDRVRLTSVGHSACEDDASVL
jgi:hypothetical protein